MLTEKENGIIIRRIVALILILFAPMLGFLWSDYLILVIGKYIRTDEMINIVYILSTIAIYICGILLYNKGFSKYKK